MNNHSNEITRDPEPRRLGRVLEELIETHGDSVYKIEKYAHVSQPVLRRILNGQRMTMEYDTLWRVAEALGLSTEERIVLFEAAYLDILTAESAKFAVYALFLAPHKTPDAQKRLDDLLTEARLYDTVEMRGVRQKTQPEPGKKIDPLARKPLYAIDPETAIGFDAARLAAENPVTLPIRLSLLYSVITGVSLDWVGKIAHIWQGHVLGGSREDVALSDPSPARGDERA